MNNALFGSLISDVVHHMPNASIRFYTSLDKCYSFALQSSDPIQTFIDINQFISHWCQISDGFATNILFDNIKYLLPDLDSLKPDDETSQNYGILIKAFANLIRLIIEELGSFITPQFEQCVSVLRTKLKDQAIEQYIFSTLYGLINSNSKFHDSIATAFRFISYFLERLSEQSVQNLLSKIPLFSESPHLAIRLAVVDTFPMYWLYDQSLFDTVFLKFFNDTETIVKTHFSYVMTSYFGNSVDLLTPYATDPNWKLRYSYIENCAQFIAINPDVEQLFSEIALNEKIPALRAEAIHRIAKCDDLIIDVDVDEAIAEEKEEIIPTANQSDSIDPPNQPKTENENLTTDQITTKHDEKVDKLPSDEHKTEANENNNQADNANDIKTNEGSHNISVDENQDTQHNSDPLLRDDKSSPLIEQMSTRTESGTLLIHSDGESDSDGKSTSSSSDDGATTSSYSIEASIQFHVQRPKTLTQSIVASATSTKPKPPPPFIPDEALARLCKSNPYVNICISALTDLNNNIRVSGFELACKLQITAPCFRRAVFACLRTQNDIEVVMHGYIPYCRWHEGTRGEQSVLTLIRESLRSTQWRTQMSALSCITSFLTDRVRPHLAAKKRAKFVRRMSNTLNLNENELDQLRKESQEVNTIVKDFGGLSILNACARYGNAFLALKLFGDVLLRVESPNFCVRNEAVEQCLRFVSVFGWDLYKERMKKRVMGYLTNNKVRTQRIGFRILKKLLTLNPPPNIKKEMNAALRPFGNMIVSPSFDESFEVDD